MDFEFATATRIVFGPGRWREAVPAVRNLGRRAMIVTGWTTERVRPLKEALVREGLPVTVFTTPGEPNVSDVQRGVEAARQERTDVVIAFGGGSAMDCGKAIAALLANPGDVYNYLEVIGRGQPLTQPAIPCIAIPTTAGTGSEVTRNAVLSSTEHRVKVSLRSVSMLPRLAIVDPELTYELPRQITATTGFDALTQLIEPFISRKANPLTDGFSLEGLRRIARSLRRASEDGRNAAAREDMSLASLLGGLALANAALGAVHALAGPIGGMCSGPHGAICAALLPHVMEVNARALREREPDGQALGRFTEVARVLTSRQSATASDGVNWVRELTQALEIEPLRRYSLRAEDFPDLIGKATQANSMKGNPIRLTPEELHEVLTRSL